MTTIRQSRGDSVTHTIPLVWNGSAYTSAADTNLIFTAKAALTDADVSARFQKTSGVGITLSGDSQSALVEVVHIDTKTLTDLSLFWDIQAQEIAGPVKTVASGVMMLSLDVTNSTTSSVTVYTTNPPTTFVVSHDSGSNSTGNTTITHDAVAGVLEYDLAVTGSAGTRIIILATTNRVQYDRIRIRYALPTTASIVIQTRNATSGGTLLDTITTDTTGDNAVVEYEFNGTAWTYILGNYPS